jgi:hypothetical protein
VSRVHHRHLGLNNTRLLKLELSLSVAVGFLIVTILPLTSPYNKVILQYMKNIQKFQTISREVRPLPFHTWGGEKWEVADTLGNDLQFFVHLTDALMYAEGVDTLDDLSRESRQYWNMVAMS